LLSYAPGPMGHPLAPRGYPYLSSPKGTPLRGGVVSLPSKAERLAVERLASSPSKIEGVLRRSGGV